MMRWAYWGEERRAAVKRERGPRPVRKGPKKKDGVLQQREEEDRIQPPRAEMILIRFIFVCVACGVWKFPTGESR